MATRTYAILIMESKYRIKLEGKSVSVHHVIYNRGNWKAEPTSPTIIGNMQNSRKYSHSEMPSLIKITLHYNDIGTFLPVELMEMWEFGLA